MLDVRKLITKYQKMDVKLKSIIWFTICTILQKGISLLCTPIYTRLLTPDEYGYFCNYQSWHSIITVIATLNLFGGVYNNGLLKYEDNRFKFTSSIQGLSTICTFIVLIIYLINIEFWNNVMGVNTFIMLIMFLELFFTPAYSFWMLKNRFEYKYINFTIITIIISVISPFLSFLGIIYTPFKVESRILGYSLLMIVTSAIIYFNNLIKGKKFFDKEIWKYALIFNLPLIPHYLSQMILQQSDRIMIDKLVGSAETAFYSVAYSISMIMLIFTNAINGTLIPYIYRSIKENNTQKLTKTILSFMIVVLAGCIFAALIAPELVAIFSTEDYYDAIWIMPPVCLSVFFIFVYNIYSDVEFYYCKTKMIALGSIIAAAINIILNYVFIPIFGYYAAGFTTVFCYILFAFFHFLVYKNILKHHGQNDFIKNKKVLYLSCVGIFSIASILILYHLVLIRYLIIVIIIILAIINYKKIVLFFKNIF